LYVFALLIPQYFCKIQGYTDLALLATLVLVKYERLIYSSSWRFEKGHQIEIRRMKLGQNFMEGKGIFSW